MTIKQALAAIRAVGLTANYSSQLQEFRILRKGGTEAESYYTDDRDDAVSTAQYIATARRHLEQREQEARRDDLRRHHTHRPS